MDANVRNTINEYFKSKPIQKAWVFGSVARGEEHPDSDVDILFVPDGRDCGVIVTALQLSFG